MRISDPKTLSIFGVSGTLHGRIARDELLWHTQVWRSEARTLAHNCGVCVQIRFDDNCNNGHNSFSITGETWSVANGFESAGCIHDTIVHAFPELEPLIKWHGCTSDGPLHYIGNTVYLAGDRDYNGQKAGEVSRTIPVIYFDEVPIGLSPENSDKFIPWVEERMLMSGGEGSFQIQEVPYTGNSNYPHTPHYTLIGYDRSWHLCPFWTKRKAEEFVLALNTCKARFDRIPVAWSEGKERELDAARSVAIWPEATDEELSVSPEVLKTALKARLPELIEAFKITIGLTGLDWAPENVQGE